MTSLFTTGLIKASVAPFDEQTDKHIQTVAVVLPVALSLFESILEWWYFADQSVLHPETIHPLYLE